MYESGLAEANTGGGDYMPFRIFILYMLTPLVSLFNGFAGFWEPLPAATLALIKLPSLLANLGTMALIYCWSRRVLALRGAALIAALHALMPPVWINIAWWGQVDALLTFPMLLAVVLFDRAGGRWSWLAWGTALLIKPQAIILAPLMYVVTLRRHGCRGLAQGGAIAGGLILLALLPLALAGQGIGLYQAVAGSVERFPLATNRAYNLWQLITGGTTVFDDTIGIGGFSYRSIGFLLIGSVVLMVCAALLRRSDEPGRAAAAAVLALAFFALPTQIHERYAFFTLPFLALWMAYDRIALLPYLLIGAAATINIFGAIPGFRPDFSSAIRTSALPNMVAAAMLILLAWLIGRLLFQAFQRPGEVVERSSMPAMKRYH
jgi:Gpi18-like mannosyltransferase